MTLWGKKTDMCHIRNLRGSLSSGLNNVLKLSSVFNLESDKHPEQAGNTRVGILWYSVEKNTNICHVSNIMPHQFAN
jgi:hypothetical protein